jgi:hypothetical protein
VRLEHRLPLPAFHWPPSAASRSSDAAAAGLTKLLNGCQGSGKFPTMTTTIEPIETTNSSDIKETRIGRLRILVHPGSGSGSECTGTCGCMCVREHDGP